MDSIISDLRYSVRRLARSPGFTTITILTLGLAIGATTALFSVVSGVLLNPLPYPRPDQLVVVESTSPKGTEMPASPQDFLDYRTQSHAFRYAAAMDVGESMTLTRPAAPAQRVNEARVGAEFFEVMGVKPALGRFFAPDEDRPSAAKTVVLSDGAWHRYFGGDPRVVDQSVTLDGVDYRVIGVARPGFEYPQNPDVWTPAVWRPFEIGDEARGYHAVVGVARLEDGFTIDRARRALGTVAARLAQQFPQQNAKIGAYVASLQRELVGDIDRALWPMLAAVIVVLLIACANVANLLLVRASSRSVEVAVRSALGAGRLRIVRQLVTETLVLWAAGGLLGIIIAQWAVAAVIALAPSGLPRVHEVAIDSRVLAFTAIVTVVTGGVFGLVPALHAAGIDIADLLRRGRSAHAGASRARSTLVLSEVALATVLLVAAGLLIRSLEKLTHVDPGFRPSHLVVFDVALPANRYRYDADMNAFARRVETRLGALPGTRSASVAADRPLDPNGTFGASATFTVDGDPKPAPGNEPGARIMPVSPNYFATLGMTLERGRYFTQAENRLDAAPVLVIDEELAHRYFPNEDPIGKHVTFGLSHHVSANPADTVRLRGEIVGIVKTAVHGRLGEKPWPIAYFPYVPAPFGATFLVRSDADPVVVQAEALRVIREIDPSVPIYELGTMDEAMSASVAQPRFFTMLLSGFSGLALLLAALGIFGVMSYAVTQRTREFGIRIALGASATDVVRSVVGRGVMLAALGILIGSVAAAGATRAITALLYDTDSLDAPTFIAAILVLGAIAALAAWLPARRAASIDPVIAMRAE